MLSISEKRHMKFVVRQRKRQFVSLNCFLFGIKIKVESKMSSLWQLMGFDVCFWGRTISRMFRGDPKHLWDSLMQSNNTTTNNKQQQRRQQQQENKM